mmetsp:Transcript_3646/g.5424  ORF Transcript_3646/g.5424 Transcript_3646/m.5424 type:complete len:282 (-) Transcript_3646:222-1067(-)
MAALVPVLAMAALTMLLSDREYEEMKREIFSEPSDEMVLKKGKVYDEEARRRLKDLMRSLDEIEIGEEEPPMTPQFSVWSPSNDASVKTTNYSKWDKIVNAERDDKLRRHRSHRRKPYKHVFFSDESLATDSDPEFSMEPSRNLDLYEPSHHDLKPLQGFWRKESTRRQRHPSTSEGFFLAAVQGRKVQGAVEREVAGIYKDRKSGKLWFRGYRLTKMTDFCITWERWKGRDRDRFEWQKMTEKQWCLAVKTMTTRDSFLGTNLTEPNAGDPYRLLPRQMD